MSYVLGMDSLSFWINPAILIGIATLLWRSQTRRFDRMDKQLREITREVIANGKNIARLQGRHEGHSQEMAALGDLRAAPTS